jgi:hypothetical protein
MEVLDQGSRLPHTAVHRHHRHTRMQPPSECVFIYPSANVPCWIFQTGHHRRRNTPIARRAIIHYAQACPGSIELPNEPTALSVFLSDANRLFDNSSGSHSPTKNGGSDGNPIMPSSVAGETISMRRFRNLRCSSPKSGSRVPLLPRGMRPEMDRVSPGCYLGLSVGLHSALPADRMRPRLMTTRRSKRIKGLF